MALMLAIYCDECGQLGVKWRLEVDLFFCSSGCFEAWGYQAHH